jgi:hypothetical protein
LRDTRPRNGARTRPIRAAPTIAPSGGIASIAAALPDAALTLAGIAAAIFAGALVSGLAGFAFSAVAGALLLRLIEPAETVSARAAFPRSSAASSAG